MNRSVQIACPDFPEISLRSASEQDQEQLRDWKNNDRKYFFHTDLITSEQQKSWFDGYLARPHDYMFVIEADNEPIGCIGFRLKNNKVDIYNVILGEKDKGGKGYMGAALKAMCAFAYQQYPGPVGLTVLKNNPAVKFYKNNGFIEVGAQEEFYLLELDPDVLKTYSCSVF